ncbi:VOC family protein [Dongshaea marina]|uniref:VOC family protein n=1 Tax=Dongshaea marina TaxID=2047966 RepID=UPI000D3E634F|nr:VOC family protein [Dongshaea marina]
MQSLYDKGLTPEQMIARLPDFAKQIQALASELKLELNDCYADHIALRINDSDQARELHQLWLALGEEISVNQINGRPIVVIRLHQPLRVAHWNIELLELPYPGEKSYPEEGWEHIEWVIPTKQAQPERFYQQLWERFPAFARIHDSEQLRALGIKAKQSSPSAEHERLPNPTLALKKDGVCIKLHPYSLAEVIASEQG